MAKKSNMGTRRAAAAIESSPFYQEKRQAIIAAAARVFQARGYEETALSHIAEEAQTDRATLYYYASSKQDLFDEVIREASEKNLDAVEAIVKSNAEPSKKLTAALAQLMETYSSDYPYLHVFMQRYFQTASGDESVMTQRTHDWAERYYNAIKAILQVGVDKGDFDFDLPIGIVTISVIGTVNWIQATGATSPQRRKTLGKKALTPNAIGIGLGKVLLKGILGRKDADD